MIVNRKNFLKKVDKIILDVSVADDQKGIVYFDGKIALLDAGNYLMTTRVKLDTVFAVKFKVFSEILHRMSGDSLHITDNDSKVVIRSGPRSEILKLEYIIPDMPSSGFDFHKIPEGLLEGINLCSTATLKSKIVGGYQNCVYIDKGNVVGCDRFRLMVYSLKKKIKNTPVLFSSNFAPIIMSISPTHYCVGENFISFKSNESEVVCFTYRDEYPGYKGIISDLKGEAIKVDVEKLNKAIDDSTIFVDEKGYGAKIYIDMEDGKLRCKGKGSFGQVENILNMKSKKLNGSFSVNPTFLKEILGFSPNIKYDGKMIFINNEKMFFGSILQ